MKRKITYQEKYKSGALRLLREYLPIMPSSAGFDVVEAEVRAAGRFDDGTEFQDLRVVLKEKPSVPQ